MRKGHRQGQRQWPRFFYSLQSRLLVMTFVIVLLPMLLASWSSLHVLKKHLVQDMHGQLRSSVSAVNLAYGHEIKRVERAIMAVSLSNTVKTTLRLEIFGQLKRELEQFANQYNLDFLFITDGLGELQVSPFPGHDLTRNFYSHPVLYEAMMQGMYSGTMLEENAAILHFLELKGKNIYSAPIVTLEAASPVIVRDKVIGYILGGVMATGNKKLMARLQESVGCKHISLVAGNRIAAVSGKNNDQFARGCRFPGALDYQRHNISEGSLHKLVYPGDTDEEIYEYQVLKMPGEDSFIALVCAYSLSRFYHLLGNIRGTMAGIFVLGMSLAMILATLMSRSIAAPLHRLTGSMGKMRQQGIYEPLIWRRDDEIGELVTGYNQMAVTIDERIADLHQEVCQRKNAEHRLAAESERLQVTLQSIADAVIAVDIKGRIVLLNRVAAGLTNWSFEEAQGIALEKVFSVKSLRTGKVVGNVLEPILEQGRKRVAEGDLILRNREGQEVQITESCAPLTDNKGMVMGAVIAFRDVTEQRLLEEELAKSTRLESVGVLAGGIAHDFNNLLTAILGNLSLARMESVGNGVLCQHLTEAEHASLRARDLTLQLLTFSRGGTPVKRNVHLAVMIRESATFVARGTNVHLEFAVAENLWLAVVDKGQIGQVVDNLVINGIQAMPEGGTITISAVNVEIPENSTLPVDAGRYIQISVKDRGTGIQEEHVQQVFDPYFTTKESGNGLGLSICYAIISKHGGYIGVRSLEDRGTIFDVYLPAVEQDDEPAPISPVEISFKKNMGTGRLLVMDDERMVRAVSQSMLKALGYDVVCVENGEEALQVYKECMGTDKAFDAVILDMTVPGGMGGQEAVRLLRQTDTGLKAIVSSGYSRHAVMAAYQEYGFDGVVAKPYRLKDLSEVLQSVIG